MPREVLHIFAGAFLILTLHNQIRVTLEKIKLIISILQSSYLRIQHNIIIKLDRGENDLDNPLCEALIRRRKKLSFLIFVIVISRFL